ncbi:MAG: cyanoexosortase A, partial [Chroococcidiopsidaceae cyanobacterium CP_BM_RX_35]|nr:cyanoexosortase A [Chroococcidiopsidaceae cyanobacterium CP_BM_RX_35]
EFILLLVLALPIEELLAHLVDLATLTAQFATFLLLHFGFEVSIHGTIVALPTGAVDVNQGCSGLRGITRLLQLSVLILAMTPTHLMGKIILPVVAILLAFVVNAVRVAVLALLIANSHRQAFDYWHEGTGSHGISVVSVILLWLFCQLLIKDESKNDVKVAIE